MAFFTAVGLFSSSRSIIGRVSLALLSEAALLEGDEKLYPELWKRVSVTVAHYLPSSIIGNQQADPKCIAA